MFDKNIFSERLSYLRKTHNISALTIAKELGISKAAISQFENCANYPHVNTLTSLADYFHVSIDYLTGRTDCPDIITKDKDGNYIAVEAMSPTKNKKQ